MKLKINIFFLIIYLVAISLFLKKIEFIPLGIAVLLLLFDLRINEYIKNLIYIIVALMPFLPFLALFLIYLPFSIFGLVFSNASFIKRYLFGFAIAIFSTLMIYTASMAFNFHLNFSIILLIFYIPVIFAAYNAYKKKKLHEVFKIKSSDYKIIIISLFFLFFITHIMLTDNSLFVSNGTYFKFYMPVKSIENYNAFAFYAPYSFHGEQLFLIDSPAFFSHITLIKILLPWLNPVLFYNYISVFILFLSILGASLIIKEVVSNKIGNIKTYIIAIGSFVIVLGFVFIQYLESFKHLFSTPVGLLIFALILSNSKKIKYLIIILALLSLTLALHAAHSLGIVLISLSLLITMQFGKDSILRNFAEFKKNFAKHKFKIITLLLIVLLIPVFYFIPIVYYSEMFGRDTSFNFDVFIPSAISYIKPQLFGDGNLLSFNYPDLMANGDPKIGILFSVFILFSLVYSLINIRKFYFSKVNMLILALFLGIIASSIAISLPLLNNMEYGYKTIALYTYIFLFVSICVVIFSFKNSILRWVLLAVLVSGFIHALPFVKTNLSNIHAESFIGGQAYKEEIDFIKQLPVDGRIITYGLFANAVDPGLHSLTDRYLARTEIKTFDFSREIYIKVHSWHSWGVFEGLESMPNNLFVNYLRLGGYKYLFLNICHPVGQIVLNKVQPNFAQPIYQNPNNQCLVMMSVNNSYYTEKVNVVSDEERESVINIGDGAYFVSINKNLRYYDTEDFSPNKIKLNEPKPLTFERLNNNHVIIKGNFDDDEWVVFKEQYFPRWKATINGEEVPVISTNDNLILIKTIKGNKIILKNELLPVEKIPGFISSLAIILFIVFLIILF